MNEYQTNEYAPTKKTKMIMLSSHNKKKFHLYK